MKKPVFGKAAALLHAAVAALVLSLASCVADDPAHSDPTYSDPSAGSIGMMYDGVWKVGQSDDVQGTVVASASRFETASIPYADIFRHLFPGCEIEDASSPSGSVALPFTVAATADGGLLYSLQPTAWYMTATVDGKCHSAALTFVPSGSGTDDISWGTLSKAGVLTLILHATAVSIDSGEPSPLSLKIAYTAVRKK